VDHREVGDNPVEVDLGSRKLRRLSEDSQRCANPILSRCPSGECTIDSHTTVPNENMKNETSSMGLINFFCLFFLPRTKRKVEVVHRTRNTPADVNQL
jgi:hypothetical protein